MLFEGLKQDDLWVADDDSMQSSIQAKLDLILGFLQFQLALIDARLEILDKRAFGITQDL